MRTLLKLAHYLAISAFVGSIFGHILLGSAFSANDLDSYHTILRAKATLTDVLIIGGIALSAASGLGLILSGGAKRLVRPWLLIKLTAVILITANALFVLRPIGLERVDLASSMIAGAKALDAFHASGSKEDMFGAVNLVLVLIVITLSIAKRVPFLPKSSK